MGEGLGMRVMSMNPDHKSTKCTPAARVLITIAVMSATLIQVLDTTIVNVALPHMQGSLSATSDEITWVLTSYLVASAIFMPLTGYFTDRFGRKTFLLVSIAGFVLSSMLCGIAINLTQLVLFRILQGVFGAPLVPLSQAIMTDSYPKEERGTALAIWGIGVMIGPILGPTLGGYLTEAMNWRWNFYINLPVGLISLALAWHAIPETPKHKRKLDWLGLLYISLAIGSLQYFLDQGNHSDWFNSRTICIVAFTCVISFLLFLLHNTKKRDTRVFDTAIFYDRNFTISSFLLGMMGLGLFGGMVVAPLMLESLFNYPVMTTGLIMAPRGISAMISMIIVGKIIRFVSPRWLVVMGAMISSAGMYISTNYYLGVSPGWIIFPFILQGLGLGMIFVPLSAIGFATLKPELNSEAAGLFSLCRTIGSSVGISIVINIFTRHTQTTWNRLGGHITISNPAVAEYIKPLHLPLSHPASIMTLAKTLSMQARMIAFLDVYMFITVSLLAMIPFVFLLKPPPKNAKLQVQHMD